jgi:Pre-mRNA splicing factor PRP21 like protein
LHVVAFAEIDWHDYAIVQTIEFTAADAAAELPPPMSVQEVENMTLAQKRMAAMVMETTAEDVEAHRARQAAAEAEAATAVSTVGGAAAEVADDDVMMEESDDEDTEASERKMKEEEETQKEVERAKAIQASSLEAGAPTKIRTDYVPKCGYFPSSYPAPFFTVSFQWALRIRWLWLHVASVANKSPSTNCKSTCELSFSTRGGSRSVMHSKLGKRKHRSFNVERMFLPHSRISHELEWISSVRRQTRRDENARKRRSANGGKKGKKWSGMAILQQRLAQSTSIRQSSISTSRLPPFTVPRVSDRRLLSVF